MVASPKRERIPTPWKTKWQRFCYHVLPVIAFVVSVIVVGRMWIHQGAMPSGIGRVEAVRVNISVGAEGKLLALEDRPSGRWKPFDEVEKGQVIARLDDRPLQAELEALRSDTAALQAELTSAELDARLDHFDRQQRHVREAAELAYQVERYRLEVLDQQARVEETRLELQRLEAQIELLNTAYSSGIGIRGDVVGYESDRQTLDEVLQARTAALRQAEENLQAAVARQQSFPTPDHADLAVLIAPLRDQIRAAEARTAEVAAQIDALVVRSPVTGTISAVHAHPGQGVRAGDWVVTIAASEADTIVGYVPAAHRFRPVEGMSVGVRLRVPGSRMVNSVVQQVGTQWEAMPAELAVDPQMPQLALPVRIEIPPDLSVLPGELVDIRFFRRRGAGSGRQALAPRPRSSFVQHRLASPTL